VTDTYPIGLSSSMLLEYSLEESIRLVRTWGFSQIEVWGDYPHAHPDTLDASDRRELRRLLEGFKRISMHAPLGGASLASMNPGIWREATREYLETIRLAHELGAELVVIHPGEVRDWRLDQIAREHCLASLRELADEASHQGIRLALENNGPYHVSLDQTAEILIGLLEEVASPALQGCLDIGHGNLNQNNAELIERFGPRLVHLHVHDNHGQRDEHLPMGWGSMDFSFLAPVFERFGGIVIAEMTWAKRSGGAGPDAMARAGLAGWTQFWTEHCSELREGTQA
jgi:sugar phosphate isomerase/epimerase